LLAEGRCEIVISAHSGNSIQMGIFSRPPWINDTDRPISSIRSAKNPQGYTMERVKGVEDLNICIIGAQGIVGVGATIRMPT
jgi:hypothetical protein